MQRLGGLTKGAWIESNRGIRKKKRKLLVKENEMSIDAEVVTKGLLGVEASKRITA